MKEKIYDIMSDYNEILIDIDAFVNVLEIQFNGVAETSDMETAKSVLRTNIHLLKGIQKESNELYNKIDEITLQMNK